MGTPLIQQRRGKGSPTYRAPSHRYFGEIKYLQFTEKAMRGEILDIVNSVGHSSPLILIKYANGAVSLLPAPMGISQEDEVWIGVPIGSQTSGETVYKYNYKTGVSMKDVRSNVTTAWLGESSAGLTWDDFTITWDESTSRWDGSGLAKGSDVINISDVNGFTYYITGG